MCVFGDLLVAILRLSSGNKCHFHYYSHPHGKLLKETNFEKSIIGASLSEPHTSVTALAEVVCMYVRMLAAIYRKF